MTRKIGRPAKGYSVSPLRHLTYIVVRLMDFAMCSLARIFPTFCSVASLSIESTPLVSSDGISTEWVLFRL